MAEMKRWPGQSNVQLASCEDCVIETSWPSSACTVLLSGASLYCVEKRGRHDQLVTIS